MSQAAPPPAPGAVTGRAEVRGVVEDTLALAPSYLVPGLATLLSVPLLFASLGPGEYGLWALMYAIATGVPRITTSWLEALILRLGHRPDHHFGPSSYGLAGGLTLAVAAVLALVLLPGRSADAIVATAVMTLAVGLYLLVVARLQAHFRFSAVSGTAVLRAVLAAALAVAGGAISHSATVSIAGMAGGFAIGAAAGAIMAWRSTGRPPEPPPGSGGVPPATAATRPLPHVDAFEYGGAWVVSSVGLLILSVGDRFVLSAFRPMSEVGVYAATYAVADLVFRFVPSIPLTSARQRLFRIWDRGEAAAPTALFVTAVGGLAWTMALVTVGLVVVGTRLPFLPLDTRLTGPIAAGLAAFVVGNALSVIYAADVQQRRLAVNIVLAAAFNLALNIVLVPVAGAYGAAVATLLGYGAYLGLILVRLPKIPGRIDRRLALVGGLAVGATVAAGLLDGARPSLPLLAVALLAIAAAAPLVLALARSVLRDDAAARDLARADGRPGLLLFAMYDLSVMRSAPAVRIARIGDALAARCRLERVAGGRRARAVAGARWLVRPGFRSVAAVYVEAPTSTMLPTDLLFLAIARLRGRPVGVYFRDAYQLFRDAYPLQQRRHALLDAIWRVTTPIVKRLATHHFAPSAGLAQVLGLREPILLPPGTDPELPDLGAGSEPLVAYVGGLSRADGFDRLLAAMELVRGELPEARLRVVAPPTDPARRTPLPPWVELTSAERRELSGLLRPARLCVIPRPISPYTELAVPVKLMDYLSFGKPVVATNAAETRALLDAAGAGIVTDDTPEALAEGLARVLRDPILAATLAQRARAFAEQPERTWGGRAERILATLLPPAARPAVAET